MMMRLAGLAMVAFLAAAESFAAGRPATVYTADGQKLVGTVLDEGFAIKTSCGVVTVPVEQMRSLWPGFATDEATGKRIERLIDDLGTPKRAKAEADLAAIGRPAVSHLQEAASASDAKVAAGVAEVLKKVWPSGAKAPSDDRDILLACGADLRGTFAFGEVHIESTLGKAAIPVAGIRVIQFEAGDPATPADPASYGPVAGKESEVEISAVDGSQVSGTLETAALDVDTPYGKVTVPLKELVSFKPGHPGEIVTRDLTLPGELTSAELPLRTKLAACKVPRENITLLKVRRDEAALKTEIFPSRYAQWQDIFTGKDLKGWVRWGGVKMEPLAPDGTICFEGHGQKRIIYQDSGPVANVVIRVESKWNSGAGRVELFVRSDEPMTNAYAARFSGKTCLFDFFTFTVKPHPMPKFFDIPMIEPGTWHAFEFGAVGKKLRAAMDGKLIGESSFDPVLPAGKVGVCVDGAGFNMNIRNIKIKTLR